MLTTVDMLFLFGVVNYALGFVYEKEGPALSGAACMAAAFILVWVM